MAKETDFTERDQRVQVLEARLAAAQVREHLALARIADLEAQLELRRGLPVADSNARLNTLLAVCAALLVTHDLDAILHLVVQEAGTLFPVTSSVQVFLAEPDGQRIILRATSHAQMPNLILHAGQGVAGRGFVAPRAMLVIGAELELALEDLDAEQWQLHQAVAGDWPPTCALTAPLRIENQRMGVMVLYVTTHAHLFHPRDLPFIQALCDLTAVAIDESTQTARAAALQRDLARTLSLHAEAQERLNAAQAQLLQSAKLAAVGELSASVAHEINNPLYAARNSLYLVEQDLPRESPLRPFLQIAQGELGRIARIITRMRDFYRPTRAELEPTDINTLLTETIELVQNHLKQNHIVVTSALDATIPAIVAHADQLRQVFLNLMLNACDAMPKGGMLHVTTGLFMQETAALALRICVSDTGVGIAAEHLTHLFEPFYTTKPHGTGLGLAISAHIVTQHNGTILVQSTLGVGSTFTVSLPVKG